MIPGDNLAHAEERAAEANTFEDDGCVYSLATGRLVDEKGGVSVAKPGRMARNIKPGDLVYGTIEDIYDQIALVRFEPAQKGVSANRTYCYIRISELSQNYARDFRDYFKIGDYIRARAKEVKELGTYLTIVDTDLGVVKAFCSRDRTELSPEGVCPKCGNRERRKWAGKPEEREERRLGGGREGRGPRGEGGFGGRREGGRGGFNRESPRREGGFRGGGERGGFNRGGRREGRGRFRR